MTHLLKRKFPSTYWELSSMDIRKEAEKLLQIDLPSEQSQSDSNPHNHDHQHIWNQIISSKSPLFVATDGAYTQTKPDQSHAKEQPQNLTSSSFVLC